MWTLSNHTEFITVPRFHEDIITAGMECNQPLLKPCSVCFLVLFPFLQSTAPYILVWGLESSKNLIWQTYWNTSWNLYTKVWELGAGCREDKANQPVLKRSPEPSVQFSSFLHPVGVSKDGLLAQTPSENRIWIRYITNYPLTPAIGWNSIHWLTFLINMENTGLAERHNTQCSFDGHKSGGTTIFLKKDNLWFTQSPMSSWKSGSQPCWERSKEANGSHQLSSHRLWDLPKDQSLLLLALEN